MAKNLRPGCDSLSQRRVASPAGNSSVPRSRRPRRRAVAAVEAAIAFTLLVPFVIGVWEVGRLVQVQQLLSNAAREGGRQAASGDKNVAAVQQVVVNYMAAAGITITASNVTVTNMGSGNDPTLATQLDPIQVTVTIPFDSVRWILINQITTAKNLSGTSIWYSMNDLPISVNTNIPAQ